MNLLVCYRKSWNTYQTREEKLPANQLEISLDVILEMIVICVCVCEREIESVCLSIEQFPI